jgi:uncharacterized membrane protein
LSKEFQSDKMLEDRVLKLVVDKQTIDVLSIYNILRIDDPRMTQRQVTNILWRLGKEGKVNLEEIRSTATLGEFLQNWERNVYLYVSLVVALSAILGIYVVPSDFPFVLIRWSFGSIFVLFIPGYVAVEVLFGFSDLDLVERIALSIGISVALTMFIGILLNYTAWGITLTPIVISLALLTLGLDAAAFLRHYYVG